MTFCSWLFVSTLAASTPGTTFGVEFALLSLTQASSPDLVPEVVLYAPDRLIRREKDQQQFQTCTGTRDTIKKIRKALELESGKTQRLRSTILEDRTWVIVFRGRNGYESLRFSEDAEKAQRLVKLTREIQDLECKNPKLWEPKLTELAFWPARGIERQRLVDYPARWARPIHLVPEKLNFAGATYHVFLPGRDFYQVQKEVELLNSPLQRFVPIDDQPYVVRAHPVFPLEELWTELSLD